jgi:hypothetical protein
MKARMGFVMAFAAVAAAAPILHFLKPESVVEAGLHKSARTPEAPEAALAAPSFNVGVNLDRLVDWSPSWTFVDAFKHSREWIPQQPFTTTPWDSGVELTLNDQGYPLLEPWQAAATLMLRDLEGRYPAGLYNCFYEGTGSLEFGMDAQVVSEAPGHLVVSVAPSNAGVFLKINESDKLDPIRNIRFVMPGFEDVYETEPFHPTFLERLEPFSSIRYMQWQRMNETTIVSWDDRPLPTDATQATADGVAFEYIAQLSNTLQRDAWICMPHTADDDYFAQAAKFVAENLDPNLRVFVELSNEVWNSSFQQSGYARDKGLAEGLSGDAFQAQLFWYSKRSVEMFKIWRAVFESYPTAQRPKLVRIMAAQHGNPWTSEQVLEFQNASAWTDALAIAPYFGVAFGDPNNLTTTLAMTPDQILAELEAEIAGPNRDLVNEHRKISRRNGVRMVAYEGGQHLVGYAGAEWVPELNALFLEVNRSPKMYDRYVESMDAWRDEGGLSFCAYSDCGTYSSWGSWGALEYQEQPLWEAHKYRALVDLNVGN